MILAFRLKKFKRIFVNLDTKQWEEGDENWWVRSETQKCRPKLSLFWRKRKRNRKKGVH